jgi:WD repeat-containing protein 7
LVTRVLILAVCDSHAADKDLISSLELRARWTVFTTPLAHVTQFQDETIGPLQGCVLCVSEDGTVAVIVIDGFQL